MSLVIDNRDELPGKPGLHVLLVGVGGLPHCKDGEGPPAEESFGIGQLDGPSTAVRELLEWIQSNAEGFTVPLSTLRALVSPSPRQHAEEPGFGRFELATFENIVRALYDWRTDAASHEDNVTVFYYASHGFGIGSDVALVTREFADPAAALMSRTLSFDNIFQGMSPAHFSRGSIARTQFYFVDAGRQALPGGHYISVPPAVAFDLRITSNRDRRTAPIFYSSVAGGIPFSYVGGLTLFAQELLAAVRGSAGEATDEFRDGVRRWRVSVNSLNAAFEKRFDEIESESAPQYYALGGIIKDATFCYLPKPPPSKALVHDWRVAGDPQLHVFIAGVSEYPHAQGGVAERARIDLGIRQLSSAASSAYQFYSWLIENRDRLGISLGSVRLLLSPTREELDRLPGMRAQRGDRCTLGNFLAAASEWRQCAADNRDGMSLFFFCGHGAQRQKGDAVLLLEDFGETSGGPLRNAVDMESLFYGMAPSTGFPDIARKQLYFVDSCRVRAKDFRNYSHMHSTPVFEVEEIRKDDRFAPVYYAAVPGDKAYGVIGSQSLFSEALIASLGGDALENVPGANGPARQKISVNSLDLALQTKMQQIRDRTEAEQEYSLEGLSKDVVLFERDR